MMGLSTSGSISLGWALVAGRKRVPRPAAGNTALRTFMVMERIVSRWSSVVGLALPGSDHCNWSLHTYATASGMKGLGCRITPGELLTRKSKGPPCRRQHDKGGAPSGSFLFADYQHYEAVWENRRIAA